MTISQREPVSSDNAKDMAAALASVIEAAGFMALTAQWPAPPHIGLLTATARRPADWSSSATTAQAMAQQDAEFLHIVDAGLPSSPLWLKQVHGTAVVDLDARTLSAMRTAPPAADAAVTNAAGVVCAVRTADCLPVALTDRAGRAVGIAHAGWRGLAAGVLENTVRNLNANGAASGDLIAWLGPAIGPQKFEVGADVHDAFCGHDIAAARCFVPLREGKWLADLYALARQRLAAMGVTEVYGGGLCTYSDPARFPSYRRDRTTDRMVSLIWRGKDA